MSQRLWLPINECAFSAGYKNAAYRRQQGYNHYGVDLYSNAQGTVSVFSPGDGVVISAGLDGTSEYDKLGRCLVIVYPDVESPDGKVRGYSCRMFHFDKIFVRSGQGVHRGMLLGEYGNTGGTLVLGKRMGKHLHIEFDKDCSYPQYAVGIKNSGKIIKKGSVDSTRNPSFIWWLGPDQNIKGIYPGWYSDEDIALRRDLSGI